MDWQNVQQQLNQRGADIADIAGRAGRAALRPFHWAAKTITRQTVSGISEGMSETVPEDLKKSAHLITGATARLDEVLSGGFAHHEKVKQFIVNTGNTGKIGGGIALS